MTSDQLEVLKALRKIAMIRQKLDGEEARIVMLGMEREVPMASMSVCLGLGSNTIHQRLKSDYYDKHR